MNEFRKMVLRVRTTEGTKRSARLSIVDEEEKRPKSVKKAKTKQKNKSEKFDAKKPKKPPTAFFFFLYVPSLLPFLCFPVIAEFIYTQTVYISFAQLNTIWLLKFIVCMID